MGPKGLKDGGAAAAAGGGGLQRGRSSAAKRALGEPHVRRRGGL